jgi:catechol 2,3-dioxygenase-like lactoylglutathione lyase family enzyme
MGYLSIPQKSYFPEQLEGVSHWLRAWAAALDRDMVTEGCSVPEIRSISAVTLATCDMARAVRFYDALGFRLSHGGETGAFTSFRVGKGYLNLARADDQSPSTSLGRVIFYVDDVDAMYAHVLAQGFTPEAPPRDASWGERYFHLSDPDGHLLSFARPLPGVEAGGKPVA